MHRFAYAAAAAPLLFELGACFSCFVAGTRISTPDGDLRIEEIQIGQPVYSYDELRKEVVIGKVSRRFVHEDMPYGKLLLSDGRQLEVTGNHPIYLAEESRYADAETLSAAQVLLLIDTGQKTPALHRETVARGLREVAGRATVYNFSVERYENYFAGGVLVHNKSIVCDDCFSAAATAEVSIERSGDGSGTFDVEAPEGDARFDCQASSCSASLTFNRTVTTPPYRASILARPDTTSRFDGWEGLCTGLFACRFNVASGTAAYFGSARFQRCAPGEWCPRYPTAAVRPDTFRGALIVSDTSGWVIASLLPDANPLEPGASTLWRFDGARLIPVDQGTAPLLGLSTNPNPAVRAWAVGKDGRLLNLNPGYAGAINSGTTRDLYGAWADETSDWFVGAGGTILRWESGAHPVPSNTTADLHAVWGSGASLAWAVGKQGTIMRWNGSTWSAVASGTSQDLHAIWGLGPTDVWAVGKQGTIVHWDGSAWTLVPSGTTAELLHVRGSGPAQLTASGRGGTLLRWNGAAWSALDGGTSADIHSTWDSSAGALHALIGDQVRTLIP